MSIRKLLTLLSALLISFAAAAQAPKVIVRTAVLSKGPAVAGQQVRLRVDALTTTWFLQAPVYPQISTPNAVVNLLDEQADHLNETINGEKWFGLSRSYLVTPTGSGDIVIPPIEITMVPGQGSGAVKAKTHAVKIAVKAVPRPTGTENMLALTHVQLSQHIDRTLEGLKVGDAFTRTIEVDAAGAQGMFIPPTEFPPIKGLAAYPKTGKVDNIIKDRVGFLGSRRVDAATYVVQQEGAYELPAVTIEWWNITTGEIEKAEVTALKFSAAPNPGYKPEFDLPMEQEHAQSWRQNMNWQQIGVIAGVIVACLAAIAWLARNARNCLHALYARWAVRRQRHEASEPAAFRRFKEATAGGGASVTYATLIEWAEHPDRPTRLRGMDNLLSSSTGVQKQFERLRTHLYSSIGDSWNAQVLLNEVRIVRDHTRPTPKEHALGPLNPV